MKYYQFIFSIFVLIVMLNFVSSADISTKGNITAEQNATLCLNQSFVFMNSLMENNFSIARVNDTLRKAKDLYLSQSLLRDRGSQYDFSIILPICNDISNIYSLAFDSRDSFYALKKFYNLSFSGGGVNTTVVDETMGRIDLEIKNERYEQVKPLVDTAYQQIIEIKSSQTAFNLFYSSTTGGIKSFFIKYWVSMLITLGILFVLFLAYRIKVARWIVQRKLRGLELRKKTIRELIMATQRGYFEKKNLSESEYSIKTKKFSEMIRDLDRQIPLLNEQLEKINRRKK